MPPLAPLLASLLASLSAALVLAAGDLASAQPVAPTVEGPIESPGTPFLATTGFDLAQIGYEQAEYFVSGTASAYTSAAPLTPDGMWTVEEGESASYKTRILVYRPVDPKDFRGTVIVEWLNVTGGLDAAPHWNATHVEVVRQGAVWVGVSAQKVGVEGGDPLLGNLNLGLKIVNPARYGTLSHPGDSFSYDIYSQAGRTVRGELLGDLKLKRVIATGTSQSAMRLVTYINGIHPLAQVFDGFLVHSRGGFSPPLSEAPQPVIAVPGDTHVREDVDVPVLAFETETDLILLAFASARQEDSKHFRLWEVAGTAHADVYGLAAGGSDIGGSPDIAGIQLVTSVAGGIQCDTFINSGPHHWVVKAALNALIRWMKTGKAPKPAPRLELSEGPPVEIVRDAHGNALGGIRTPYVDAPIATLTGHQDGSFLCRLFGSTAPFDDAKLASLYPTEKDFTSAWKKSLRRAVQKRWILKPDAKLIEAWAEGSGIGG